MNFDALRASFRKVKQRHPFTIDAFATKDLYPKDWAGVLNVAYVEARNAGERVER